MKAQDWIMTVVNTKNNAVKVYKIFERDENMVKGTIVTLACHQAQMVFGDIHAEVEDFDVVPTKDGLQCEVQHTTKDKVIITACPFADLDEFDVDFM